MGKVFRKETLISKDIQIVIFIMAELLPKYVFFKNLYQRTGEMLHSVKHLTLKHENLNLDLQHHVGSQAWQHIYHLSNGEAGPSQPLELTSLPFHPISKHWLQWENLSQNWGREQMKRTSDHDFYPPHTQAHTVNEHTHGLAHTATYTCVHIHISHTHIHTTHTHPRYVSINYSYFN